MSHGPGRGAGLSARCRALLRGLVAAVLLRRSDAVTPLLVALSNYSYLQVTQTGALCPLCWELGP